MRENSQDEREDEHRGTEADAQVAYLVRRFRDVESEEGVGFVREDAKVEGVEVEGLAEDRRGSVGVGGEVRGEGGLGREGLRDGGRRQEHKCHFGPQGDHSSDAFGKVRLFAASPTPNSHVEARRVARPGLEAHQK